MNNLNKKILIVDDSELNRALLDDILHDSFEIIEAENGMEAMAIMHERSSDISLMLLDIVMPEMDGFEVLAMMNKHGWIQTTPVIMISSENGGAYIDRAYDLGAIDYITRPFDERTVKHRVMSNFLLSIRQSEMHEMLSDQMYEKEKDNSLMIEILSNIVEFRNGESGLHVLHVHAITEMLLKQLVKKTDKYKLTDKDIRLICTASALHDIGKISIPTEILNKPGRFSPEEYEIMKKHTIEGAKMLENIPFRKNETLVKISYQICRWHHERYDGFGYPDGLKGDDIPIAAQVVAIADVYDALTSERCYKPAMKHEEALAMILSGECGAFNPLLLECLTDIASQLKKDLEVVSYGHSTDESIRETVAQLLKTDGNDVSRRLVKQMEYERLKYKYLADISREITFEYVVSPEMIKLSDWNADSLGLPVAILNPRDNEQWNKVFDKEAFADFLDKLSKTTRESAVVNEKYLLDTGEGARWNSVIAKAIWSESEEPELEGAICKIIDVNETTLKINHLTTRAEHDSLTGLFNHRAARSRIEAILAANRNNKYALVFFDIDDFKKMNDTHGHGFGDSVIKKVAARLMRNTRSSDIAARVGGDEFLLFLEYSGITIEKLVERIFSKLTGEYDGVNINISMGVAPGSDEHRDYEELFNMADIAMYAVKKAKGGAYRFYDDSLKPQLDEITEKHDDDTKDKKKEGTN